MISPELLRHYPFFRFLNESQLREIAMIAEEESIDSGLVLFHEGQTAAALYFLEEGHIDLYYAAGKINPSDSQKGIPVGEINPGEPFSISAVIEPYILTSTAFVSKPSRLIKIEAKPLRALFNKDLRLAYLLTYQAAKAAKERLFATRIQLAAAWA
jgi:CRP-like cAMP-binding protein